MQKQSNITPRELDVLQLLNHHLADKEIATHLGIKVDTAKDHVKSIRKKLDAINRGQAVDIARQLGIISRIEILKAKKNNLLQQATPLIGRKRETQEIINQLTIPYNRLITIMGLGGIGKTRLAYNVGYSLLENDTYPDGIFCVSLISLDSEYHLIHALADALSMNTISDKDIRSVLIDFLSDKSILLILDNYEHFLPQISVISEIIESTKTDILITSRERLNVYGESPYMVNGLPHKDAFAMFILYMGRVQQTTSTTLDEKQIHRICKLVEGFPLAIELAVSWGHILPIHTIADEIEKSLDILESKVRNIPDRHRSIRAVFDYSINFLPAHLKSIFLSLAFCKSSFDLIAVRAMCNASLLDIRDLVDKSLIYVNNHRYSFHELVRQYALETLKLDPALENDSRTNFIQYYTNFLVETATGLHTAEESSALTLLKREFDNIRNAVRIALDESNFNLINKCLYSLLMFYELNSLYEEGGNFFKKVFGKVPQDYDKHFVAKVQLALCAMTLHTKEFQFTKDNLTHCIAILYPSNPYWLGIGYRLLGELETNQGNSKSAKSHLIESIEIYEEIHETDSDILLALSERQLGLVLQDAGEVEEALEHYKRSQDIFSRLRYERGIAMVLHRLGELEHQKGNYHDAKAYYIDSLAIHENLKDTDAIGRVYNKLGSLAYIHGNLDQAKEYFQVSFDISESLGAKYQLVVYANNLGVIAQDKQDFEQALVWFEKCRSLAKKIGDEKHRGLALNNLGRLAYSQKQYDKALDLCLQSLEIRRKTNYVQGLLYSLCDVGNAFVALEQIDKAMQVYIEGLQLAIKTQSVVRGLDLLFAIAPAIHSQEPCMARNITKLVITHQATQAKTRHLADNFSKHLIVDEYSCHDDIDDWEQLAIVLINTYYSAYNA